MSTTTSTSKSDKDKAPPPLPNSPPKTPAEDSSIDELTKAVQQINVAKDTNNKSDVSAELLKVAHWIQTGSAKKILVLSGAGVSVAAGIPDFRTPGTGLYDNLKRHDLPFPEAVFDLDFYRENPAPFCSLASEIWPGVQHTPTLTHSFLALLAERKLLLRNYSQNIDGLEYLAGIPASKLVECHGHFRTASCTNQECGAKADAAAVKQRILEKATAPVCKECQSYVKPDIVFFGEGLPSRFHALLQQDLKVADMVLILGTSLQVAPVSMIPDMVNRNCKRVLFNRELVGDLDLENDTRDLFHAGDCDDTIRQLAALLEWQEDLDVLDRKAKDSIRDKETQTQTQKEKETSK